MADANLGEYEDRLKQFLRLNTFPVAVRFQRSWDEVPPRAKRPARDLKNRITTCQAISMSRRHGWVIALGREDSSCVLGAVALGIEKRLPHYDAGNRRASAASRMGRGGTAGWVRGISGAATAQTCFFPTCLA